MSLGAFLSMGIQPALTQLRRISVLAAGMYSNPCIRVLDGRVGARVGGNGSSNGCNIVKGI